MRGVHYYISAAAMVLSVVNISFGQAAVKGKIKDGEQNLASVSVQLVNDDSVLVKSTFSNNEGEFFFDNIMPGNYRVACSAVGHTTFLSKVLKVDTGNAILPDIILEKQAAGLKEVIVKAKKPLYEQQPDKLVINVQGSINSSGNTVLEILQKSPGITVDKQSNIISMNGKSGAKVMMNGKLMQVPMDVVVQMLDGMSAANVEKIELITNPPAKYDAEGNAGIIHIVVKGNADVGTNASMGLTLGYRWAETLGGNFTINHKSKRFAYFLDYSILRNHNQHISRFEKRAVDNGFMQIVTDNSERENVTTQQNLNAGLEWKLSSNTSLGLSLTGYRRDWRLDAINYDNNRFHPDSTVITNMGIRETNIWQSATAGIGLKTKINPASELSINLDYLYYHNNNPSDYNDTSFYKQPASYEVSKIDLKKKTPIRFYVVTVDYTYHLSPVLTIETGVKGVTTGLDNNVLTQRMINNAWIVDSVFTSFSTLSENTGAAYVSTTWLPGKQWTISSGLRYEYTHTTINTPTQQNLVNRRYGYLFPSLFFKKNIRKDKDIQVSYTRRITRPGYSDIAPFVFFWGPNSFSAGNTSLLPAIADAVKAGFYMKKWVISTQFTHSKNEINAWQPERDQSNNLIYRAQNLDYLNSISISNAYYFNIAPWWEVQANITGQYQVAKTTEIQHNETFRWYSWNAGITNLLKLPADFSIEISGIYQSKTFSGIAEYLPTGFLNAGVQKKFGAMGTFRLAMDDIFNTNYWRIKTDLPGHNLNSYFHYNFHNQFIRLTYTRNFGNKKLQLLKLKSGSEEERGRVNN